MVFDIEAISIATFDRCFFRNLLANNIFAISNATKTAFLFVAPQITFWLLQIIIHFRLLFVSHILFEQLMVLLLKICSILNIDDYCLEITPRNNSSLEKDRYFYGFGNKNSKTFVLKTSK